MTVSSRRLSLIIWRCSSRSGRWRARYVVDLAQLTLTGDIKIDVHYWENGRLFCYAYHTGLTALTTGLELVGIRKCEKMSPAAFALFVKLLADPGDLTLGPTIYSTGCSSSPPLGHSLGDYPINQSL